MADQEHTRRRSDQALAKKLEELQRQFEADSEFPDVVAAWEAIGRITKAGQPSPFPAWVNSYLSAAAEKIGRLWLGIDPENERPIEEILSSVGELRGVPRGRGGNSRDRDVRTKRVAAALGFAQKGRSVFQHCDKSTRDTDYLRIHDDTTLTRDAEFLRIYDDPALEEDKQLQHEVRREVIKMMMKNENLSELAARNRLSKARCERSRNHHPT